MAELGFREKNRYFTHPGTQHIIEFPSGPLSVGEAPIKRIKGIRYDTSILRIISPTDCVKDRLAAYYFWEDRRALTRAVLVAIHNRVNMSEIRKWSQTEGNIEKFKIFFKRYAEEK